jgi:3-oxoacid CoA-transferase subunit B
MKARLDDQTMALRVAKEFQDGMVVNLGFGIPTLASNFVPEGRTVILHAENGVLHYGPIADEDTSDPDLMNASGQYVIPLPGMSIFGHEDSFDMIRGGHIDLAVLGGLQVSERGDLANWFNPEKGTGGIGGAMDLAVGAKKVFVTMHHVTRDDRPKIVKKLSYPVTANECVDLIITDIAVIEVTNEGLVLKEVAPGWTAAEVQALTEPRLIVADDLKEISF